MAEGKKYKSKYPTIYNVNEMIPIIEEYIDTHTIPVLKELCYQNYWVYETVIRMQNEHPELRQSIKRLLDKKEANLELGVLSGKVKATMAIFSLKQLGWHDSVEISANTGEIKPLEISFVRADKVAQQARLSAIEKQIKGENASDTNTSTV